MEPRTALFAGSFDPFTVGHRAIVLRALELFDRVVVAVGYNEHKKGWLPVENRLGIIRDCFAGEPRVEAALYNGLTADFAHAIDARVLLRGVRTSADFEAERTLADVNLKVGHMETVLLVSDPELSWISSSVVRELAHNGHDVSPFIPTGNKYLPK